MGENIDELAFFRYLTGVSIDAWHLNNVYQLWNHKILKGKIINGLIAKCQVCQYFPLSINCAIQYIIAMVHSADVKSGDRTANTD